MDKNAAYPPAVKELQGEEVLPEGCELRPSKYVNNMVEQGHRGITRRVNPGLGFGAFATAERPIPGYEAIHMLRKGQIKGVAKREVLAQNRVINQRFGLAS